MGSYPCKEGRSLIAVAKKYVEASIMKNVEMTVDGDVLSITVDISKTFGKSSSGKSTIIASTEGNVSVTGRDEVKIGLNVYTK
jgi:ABC-type polar amino acid transport system ATPase subunit